MAVGNRNTLGAADGDPAGESDADGEAADGAAGADGTVGEATTGTGVSMGRSTTSVSPVRAQASVAVTDMANAVVSATTCSSRERV
ncbi:hypothetical protein GCM10009828_030360 [Actinoplanes couchii]|uniref:Uncharacterized protein n=1 Tax=Actinoplanes couchii TaxID=403638 RepID=A0ABQ3XBY7_9ACTN|nr:hypothetical protein Aco03nite_044000 [Actinoplanes couchii]